VAQNKPPIGDEYAAGIRTHLARLLLPTSANCTTWTGQSGRTSLILLHGGRDHCRNWDWVAADLRRDYHVIAPDLRGHGDSRLVGVRSLHHGQLHLRFRAVDPSAGLAPVSIIAHSLGGICAALHRTIRRTCVHRRDRGVGPGPGRTPCPTRSPSPNGCPMDRCTAWAVRSPPRAIQRLKRLCAHAEERQAPDAGAGAAFDAVWCQPE